MQDLIVWKYEDGWGGCRILLLKGLLGLDK